MFRPFRLPCIGLIILLATVFAQNAAGETVKGKYFSTSLPQGADTIRLLAQLNASYFLRMNVAFTTGESNAPSDPLTMLGETIDAIFLETSDALDIHIYSFNAELVIVQDKNAIAQVLKDAGIDVQEMPSFFFSEKNRIYISAVDLNAGMLSHEIAHAIITRYFVVPPPVKVQEVLAGYAEYSIRKHLKTLPTIKTL